MEINFMAKPWYILQSIFQKIQFAKEKSDVIAKVDGTFQIREKPENYFELKFEEKFVKKPLQIKAKV